MVLIWFFLILLGQAGPFVLSKSSIKAELQSICLKGQTPLSDQRVNFSLHNTIKYKGVRKKNVHSYQRKCIENNAENMGYGNFFSRIKNIS